MNKAVGLTCPSPHRSVSARGAATKPQRIFKTCSRGCNEATTHFQALHRSARGAATKPQRIFKPSTALLAGLQRSHNAFSSPPPLCSRGCNEATTHFQALHRSVCAVRGPCCRHQEEGVQHPNDQQQRLSLSAARWKETEGTAIDIARQARMVSVSARIGPHPLSLSACIGPARIGISRPTSPLARPPSTAEDHRGSRVYWFRHRPVNSTCNKL